MRGATRWNFSLQASRRFLNPLGPTKIPEQGRDGRTGQTDGRTDGRTDRTDGRDGRTEYSFTVLGRRNTVLQYYSLFICLASKLYFRNYINYLVVST